MRPFALYVVFSLSLCRSSYAQYPSRFDAEVNQVVAADTLVNKNNVILFTGSSSIRLWKDLALDYPEHNIVNRGFGGSEMHDLLYFANKLILPYNPKVIFIYEGDNDINSGKAPDQILQTADSLLVTIRKTLPTTPIIFISSKPSVARWHIKSKYEVYNKKLKSWTRSNENVEFADIWTPMLDRQGNVRTYLFIEDRLHMNKNGYAIWARVLRKYLR
jgi:lysophospholipase L1-like esterase